MVCRKKYPHLAVDCTRGEKIRLCRVEIKTTNRTGMACVAEDQRFRDAEQDNQSIKNVREIHVLGIRYDLRWIPQGKFAVFHTSCNDAA